MELIKWFIDVVLHLDSHLAAWAQSMGGWLYVVLIAVVFCETGLVVTPFLPGDSLLFATGAVVALPGSPLALHWTIVFLIIAAVVGDAVNYSVGFRVGASIIARKPRWLNPDHIKRTEAFYAKHGSKTIVFARFVPIVRTFAPFVAGIGKMPYRQFALYNVTGAVVWVTGFVLAGYWFGNMPIVKRYFQLVIIAIIILSVLPIAITWWRARKERAEASADAPPADVPSDESSPGE